MEIHCKKSKISIHSFQYICRYTKNKKNRAFKEFRNQRI